MTWIEAIAVVFGLLGVWLTIRQNIWCWPAGLVQVTLYIQIFYQVKLYSDLILHVIYVGLQVYGWHYWLHGDKDQGTLEVSRLSVRDFLGWIAIATAGTAVWGWSMASFTDAAVPYWDAFIAVASLVAQWLMTRKQLESWLFWIAVNVVAIGVYWYKSLFLTTGLYTVFLVMAMMGFFAWQTSMNARLKDGVADEDRTNARKICPTA